MTVYEEAADLDVFQETLRKLAVNRFYSEIGADENVAIDEENVRKAAWLASLLANSPSDTHRQRALSFTVLAYLWAKQTEDEEIYEEFLQIVFSRLGSIPVAEQFLESKSRFLENIDNSDQTDSITTAGVQQAQLRAARDRYRATNSIHDQDTEHTYNPEERSELDTVWNRDELILTRFQSEVWSEFSSKQFIGFSGPTSSGKSYLLRKYISRQIQDQNGFTCLYVVPTRALIAEVAGAFSEKLSDDVAIHTNVSEQPIEGSQIYVLTPERCLNLFDIEDDVDLDLIFIDELQNLDGSPRALLFEFVYEMLLSVWPSAQVIGAGPFIKNIQEPISELRDLSRKQIDEDYTAENSEAIGSVKTDYSPIYRLRSSMTLNSGENQIQVRLKDQIQDTEELEVDRPTGFTYSTVSGSAYEKAAKFIDKFQQDDEPILVYAWAPHRARDIAQKIAAERDEPAEERDVSELTNFLESSVHEEYPLIETLPKGVGYHHGKVPQVARSTVESYFRNGNIDVLVSTSTLLEGVNLPAAKLLVVDSNRSKDEDLTPFELQNLIGRVGRVGSRLHGQVFYVDHGDDEWAAEKVEQATDKEIIPVSTQILSDKYEKLMWTIKDDPRELSRGELKATSTILKTRYVIDEELTKSFLDAKGIENNKRRQLEQALSAIKDDLSIPPSLVRQNPTIDPEIQNELYEKISETPEHFVTTEDALSEDLLSIIEKINEIAVIHTDGEAREDHTEIRTPKLSDLKNIAYNWITGASYSSIIYQQDSFDSSDEKSVSKVIRNIETDVRFVLTKYFKLIGDILQHVEPDRISKQELDFMKSLDTFAEQGSTDTQELALMNMGAARSVAIELSLPRDAYDPNQIRKSLTDRPPGGFKRTHLRSQGIIEHEDGEKE